ncbi:hypothetical protein [Cellulosilyticum ruminicola]|uniref:hypothetical protein n=1 Tax=Cellulosilyticum ruminicola TaxID=425254 RepID=UPI0006D1EFB2|nr:hypothetical protein [Cellulosilyticum ruminicola]
MDELIKMLEQIYGLLEQISTITVNQTTVLLQSNETIDEANDALEMLESMVSYKEEITDELVALEKHFDTSYDQYRGKITETAYVQLFKEWVGRIMAKKQEIVDAEKNNVMIMQTLTQRKVKRMEIPKAAKQVTDAYKRQQQKY